MDLQKVTYIERRDVINRLEKFAQDDPENYFGLILLAIAEQAADKLHGRSTPPS